MTLSEGGGVVRSIAVGGTAMQGAFVYCVVVTLGQINSGCIIEGGLLTQVQTHAMETSGYHIPQPDCNTLEGTVMTVKAFR